jgi:hypothetical protein
MGLVIAFSIWGYFEVPKELKPGHKQKERI